MSEIIILGAALGCVIFLFVTDYFFRRREEQAEQALEKAKEEAGTHLFPEIKEKGDEANLAA